MDTHVRNPAAESSLRKDSPRFSYSTSHSRSTAKPELANPRDLLPFPEQGMNFDELEAFLNKG